MDTPRFIYVLQFGKTLSSATYTTKESAEASAANFGATRIVQFVEVLHTEDSV